jgi:hypothetical protein
MEFLRDEAIGNAFPAENDLCAGGPYRPYTVGPQEKSRGQYAYDLWNNDRLFGSGFDDSAPLPPMGYGMSPPEIMGTSAATTSL